MHWLRFVIQPVWQIPVMAQATMQSPVRHVQRPCILSAYMQTTDQHTSSLSSMGCLPQKRIPDKHQGMAL